MHPLGVHGEQAQHVLARAVGDGDDRIGHLDRGPLDPRAHVVPAAELLALPRPQRLERVDGQDERDAVRLLGEDAGEVRVPGVHVDDVRVDRVGDHRHVPRQRSEQRPQPLVGCLKGMRCWIAADPPAIGLLGERPEGADVELDELAQVARQLADVDPGTTVDLRRELVRQDERAHAGSLAAPYG